MAARAGANQPPFIDGATDGTIYQTIGGVSTPVRRGDGTAPQPGDVMTVSSDGLWIAAPGVTGADTTDLAVRDNSGAVITTRAGDPIYIAS